MAWTSPNDAPSGGGGTKWKSPNGGGGSSILSKVTGAAGKVLSPIGEAISAPQQELFHGIQGIKDVAHGNVGGALGELKNMAKGGLALGTAGASTALTKPAPHISFTQTVGAKKLPFGLETLGSIATDPLTYATLGLGPEARAGLEGIKAMEGGEELANAVRQGGMKSLDSATKAGIKQHLVEMAGDVSEKQANKIAEKQMSALASRGAGGVGAHIPFTDINAHIAGSFDPVEGFSKLANESKVGRKLAPIFSKSSEDARLAERDAEAASKNITKTPRGGMPTTTLSDSEREAEKAVINEARAAGKITTPAEEIQKGADKVFNTVRSQMLAFPGTVGNRFRRGVTMNLLDHISPAEQLSKGREFLTLQKAGKEVETALGLDSETLDHAVNDIVTKSQKSVAKAAKAGQGQASLFPVTERTYKDALNEVLQKKGLGLEQFEAALNKAGIDGQRYINLRQIMATSGHNLYSADATATQKLLEEGGGKVRTALKGIGATGEKYYTGPIKHAGTAVENFNRGVSALANLDRYGNVEKAAEQVKRIVGDPWALTKTEKKLKFASPFVGSIRSHVQGVVSGGLDNPGALGAVNHTLGEGPLSTGSGNPVGSAQSVLNVPANALGGNEKAAFDELGNLTGGPTAALFRLMNNAHALPEDKQKQYTKILQTVSPTLQRLPTKGKKNSLLEQLERFITGTSTG